MVNERPVTGFCERCRQAHELLIPEPGLGDRDFQRIGARFCWCAGCGRVVGRTCCWDGSAGLCPDCMALRAAKDPSLTDAVLTRNALSALSAATDAVAGLEARLGRLTVSEDDVTRNAWEDAWLEMGIAIVRADHATDTARRRGAEASVTSDDQEWLTRQLASRGGAWDARHRAVVDRVERVGTRIHALGTVDLPAATPMAPAEDSRLVAVPMTRASSPVRPQPVGDRALVGARQSVTAAALTVLARPDAPPPAPDVSPPTRPIPVRPARPAQKDLPARRVVLALRDLETNGAALSVHDRRPTPAAKERAVAVVPARPRPAEAPRISRRAGILLAAVLTMIGAFAVALAAIDRLGGIAEPAPGALGDVQSTGESGSEGTGAVATAGIGEGMTAAVVTFDREPLGPLRNDATAIVRVLGAPDVAALPTSFDRSLLLAVEGAGACLVGVPGEPTRSLGIDMLTGSRVGGTLRVTPTDRPDEAAALVLSRIAGLAPNTWYSIQLGWTGSGAISFEIREREGGSAVRRGTLTAEAGGDAGSGSVCLKALGVSEATAMHLDNVVVGS